MRNFWLALLVVFSGPLWAQFDDAPSGESTEKTQESNDPEVEALYDKVDDGRVVDRPKPKNPETKKAEKAITNLTELGTLEPFRDVAVIQRRFLPRTQRFDVSANAMLTLNNPFFNNMGVGVRGAYHFAEKYGLELQYFWLSNSEREVTKGLRDRLIQTTSLVTPKNYMGAAFKWNPIYGKVTFMNKQIVPFDLHFTVGGGLTETTYRSGEPTFHIGSGQVFALNKSMAFRWDFVWNFYNATAIDKNNNKVSTSHDDLFICFGMSFFFPEATYR